MLVKVVSEVVVYAYRHWIAKMEIQELEAEKARIAASRLAEVQAAERAKSLFLVSMSHEIRTPLNAVIGLSQELQNDDLSPDVRKSHLRSINEASRALLDLINDVLDISKLESGHLHLAIAETGVSELVRAYGDILWMPPRNGNCILPSRLQDATWPSRLTRTASVRCSSTSSAMPSSSRTRAASR